MDNPWANAWEEPSTTSKKPPPAFATDVQDDDEEDIAIPSWEPPASFSDQNSLWGARSPAHDKFPVWHSSYEDLPLGKSTTSLPAMEDIQPEEASEDEEEEEQAQLEPEPESEPEPEIAVEPPELSSEPSPSPSPPVSAPGSPDAFGTFETGLDDLPPTSDPWTPAAATFVPEHTDSAWGDAAWEPSADDHETPAVVDEWEAAKQQKDMQDKHVPPELLASILLQFTELADDLYPTLPRPSLDPSDYRASRHKGLDGIDSLNPTIMRLLPTDLTLPPPRPFPKSAIAKHTSEGLRLVAPLSRYGSTKGSTAWEASIKNRPEVVGWRLLETKKEEAAVVDKKKSGHGGLLSFFGRLEGANARPSTPRASVDSVRSPTGSNKSPTASTAASAAVSPIASSSTPPPPLPLPTTPTPTPPLISQSLSDTSLDTDATTVTPAPSAATNSTGHQNLALSEGDFDFLADIEGAAAESSFNEDTNSPIMGAFFDKPVPLPAKLPPPPRLGEKSPVSDLPIFGDYNPSPPLKPTAPPMVASISAPAPAPKPMPAGEFDIDFSAWGLDDEVKTSEPMAIRPPPKQVLNTRAVTNTRGAAPPPRRAPTAIMSSGPSKPSAVVPNSMGRSTSYLLLELRHPLPLSPPPPGSKPATAKPAPALLDDDDEFSDFHAHTPTSLPTSNSFSSQQILFASTSNSSVSSDLFDDFDDFMQASPQEPTTLRTPSPPRPPSKPSHITLPTPLSLDAHGDDDTPLALIAAHGSSSHQPTSGVRWPAPASPLPEIHAIVAPPNAKPDLDPFGFGASTMQAQQVAFLGNGPPKALSPPPPASTPPVLAPPPGFSMRATSPPVLAPPSGFTAAPMRAMSPPVLAPPPGFSAAPMRAMSPPVLAPPPGFSAAPMRATSPP
ncbi:hypothetical protein FB45DRAFT_925807, partial [Roridomyces roridus]